MNRFRELKRIAWEANMDLPVQGLVRYSFGNVSAADRDRAVFAIKPSGIPYDALKPSDMVVVDLENRIVEGKLRPSSDTKTHAVLYRHFPEIGGVCHTHSGCAVAWAQAGLPIPILGTTHADHLAFDIPCTRPLTNRSVKGDYEEETGLAIVKALAGRTCREIEMALVAGHGPFTWGATAEKAVYNSVMLEEIARMAWMTLEIRPGAPRLNKSLIDKHYLRKHGRDATYGQKK
ncbi:L-ribulose-5-phosphate 4-epimerase AraD [bacterium]|nr:L-ribulose-5-phosphate 4-epimerase AraD [bacterium]